MQPAAQYGNCHKGELTDKSPPGDEIKHFGSRTQTPHIQPVPWQGDVSSPDDAPH